ncbi:TIGR02678 family protein [Pseudokineococcus basanitobsidens]|uniref:TIGR02678 family protein n=1 Tax=Pseudokineococcus basanitobsidens TaxID=1926649 RepID=A0ABU8RNX9_9ACTN
MSPPPGTDAASALASTEAHDAAERREAARALLVTPFVTASTAPQTLTLVRRHSAALRQAFATQLGCTLVVEASFARLVKAPPAPGAPSRPLRRGDVPLAPRTYAYLSLLAAGLLAPDVGEQVLVSALVEQVRADAAAAGIEVGDSLAERRRLVAAVEVLVGWGVLTETDGSVGAWGERRDEALLTVHRPLLPHLLARPLQDALRPGAPTASREPDPGADPEPAAGPEPEGEVGAAAEPGLGAAEAGTAEDTTAEGPDTQATEAQVPGAERRSLRRRLVEDPLVRREDLSPGEADALSRDRRDLGRVLDDLFGLTLEVRAEGALAYDPDGEVTDVVFPGPGTVRQAALLLLDALLDRTRPEAGTTALVDGRERPGVLAPWALVDEELTDLAGRNAAAWAEALATDVPRLRSEVVTLLESLSLARSTDAGLVVHPAAARYRPDPQRAEPTRARRRAAAGERTTPAPSGRPSTHVPPPEAEASLFDLEDP